MPEPSRSRFFSRATLIGGLLLAVAALATPAAQAADAEAADQAFYQRAASCAAVMKHEVVRLGERWRAGDRNVKGEARRLTELSFTFVGIAYKRGLRGEAADKLLADAERAQTGQATPALRQLSSDCQAEAGKLLERSNVLERALVRNRAKARVEQLMPDPAR
jgi:hypothetical protein